MQVGNISLTPSMDVKGKSTLALKGTNFLGLLGSIMNVPIKPKENGSVKNPLNSLSKQDLTSLISFLKTPDCLDLNGGNQLLGKESDMKDSKLLETITSFLGLTKEDLNKSLKNLESLFSNLLPNSTSIPDSINETSFLDNGKVLTGIKKEINPPLGENQLSLIDSKQNKKIDKQKPVEGLKPQEKQSTGSDILAELIASLNQMMSMPIQSLPKLINQDFQDVAKTVKVFELLTKNQDQSGNKQKLSQLIGETIQKLESLVNQGKGTTRLEYLQNTFNSLANDSNSENHPRQEKEPITPSTLKVEPNSGLVQFQQMSKPEQLMSMIDSNGKPISSEQFIQQFENILSKSQFSNVGGEQKLFIKLNPENLGSLRIELIQKDSSITAKILTTTSAAKDALESQLQGLKTAFNTQNILVDHIEVSQMMDQQERFFQGEREQGSRQNQEQQRKQQKEEQHSDFSFEELLNIEV